MILNGSFHGRPNVKLLVLILSLCSSSFLKGVTVPVFLEEVEALKELEERSVMEAKGLWQEHRNNKDRSPSPEIGLSGYQGRAGQKWPELGGFQWFPMGFQWVPRVSSGSGFLKNWGIPKSSIFGFSLLNLEIVGDPPWIWKPPAGGIPISSVRAKVWWPKATSWARCALQRLTKSRDQSLMVRDGELK